MIYLDSSALLKFVGRDKETDALRAWRGALPVDAELLTSDLATVEVSRTLFRAGVDQQRVPFVVGQALRGLYVIDLTTAVLSRAKAYGIRRLGSLDAIHLATADPFLTELDAFVTYDSELSEAAAELGMPVLAPA